MSRWLQRFTVFVLIAGLIVGGLGWATAAALRMEENHRRAEAQKERADKMRHAMLRLDSLIAPPLARENSRPFDHFTPGRIVNVIDLPPFDQVYPVASQW